MNKYLIFGVVGILGYGGYKMSQPRGIRNNNPGNIRLSGDAWRGLKNNQTDSDFFQFTSPVYGIRALVRVLRNYQSRHGLNTIEEIIRRYAPSSENNTGSYIHSVSSALRVSPSESINVNDHMPQLVAAIINHENGQQPYSYDKINAGIELA